MAVATLQCKIEEIAEWHSHLFLEPHIVACVAVLSKYSASPATIKVECTDIVSDWLAEETQLSVVLSWSAEMAQKAERLRFTMQAKPMVELAAIAFALILAHRVVNLGQLDVASYGERIDYRSVDVPVVLEISGTENLSEVERRQREKVAQALRNPLGLDAYVVVCGFSADKHRVRFSYHRWGSNDKQ